MKKKTVRPAARRRAPAPLPVNPQLLMLGIVLDGPGGTTAEAPRRIHDILRAALVDADALLRRIPAGDKSDAWDVNRAIGLIYDRMKPADEWAVVQGLKDPSERREVSDALETLTLDTAQAGLWLGMAIAYRYFGLGGAR